MTEDVDWGACVHGTHGKYVTRYLAYAEARDQPTAVDYDALKAELPTVLTAMDRAHQQEQWERVRRFGWALCNPIDGCSRIRGHWGELRFRLRQAMHAAETEGHRRDAAGFAANLATMLMDSGDPEAAAREYQHALAVFEEIGECRTLATLYHQLGLLAQNTGKYVEVQHLFEKSIEISEELGSVGPVVLAATLNQLGMLAQVTGDYAEARHLYGQSLAVHEELQQPRQIAAVYHQLGTVAQDTGGYVEARRLLQHSLDIKRELGNKEGIAISLHELGDTGPEHGRLCQSAFSLPAKPAH